jgi:peptidyl-prolyl cis-trans isomerase SurA
MRRLLAVILIACALPAAAAIRTVDRVVAVVNRDVITQIDLNDKVESIRQNLAGQRMTAPPAEELEKQALDQMITESVLRQYASQIGLSIDDAQLESALTRIAEQNGNNLADFRRRVESEGLNWRKLREEIRLQMLMSRLREREVDSKITIGDDEVADYLRRNINQPQYEYQLAHILISLPENASPEQVQAGRLRVQTVEKRIREGLDFSTAAASWSNAPDATIGGQLGWRGAGTLPQQFVEMIDKLQNGQVTEVMRSPAGFHLVKLLDRRVQDEKFIVKQTLARHILVKSNELVSEDEARQKLTLARQRIVSGESFESLARTYSEDGTAAKGGELGWLSPGETVPDFEQAMDKLAPGELSAIVKSPFGFHLIQVIERRDQDMTAQRRELTVRQELKQRRSDEIYDDWVRQLRDRASIQIRLKDE